MNWIHTSLGAALFYSFSDILYKHVLNLPSDKFFAYISILYLFFGLAGIMFFSQNIKTVKSLTNKEYFLIIVISALSMIGSLLVWKSYSLAPQPALPRGIMAVQLILLLIISCLVFNVKTSMNEIVGILLVILGTLFISFGK